MKAGGIFGNGALGIVGGGVFGQKQASGLGIAVDTGVESWNMGEVAAKAACYLAGKLGESDRVSGKAMVTTTAHSRIGYVWASDEDKLRVSECYANGYMSVTPGTSSSTPTPTDTPSTTNFVGPTPDTGAGKACTDQTVIASVQGQIGVNADGKWGPKSQAALASTGKTFKSFAPNCKEPVPYYGGASGGGGGGTTTSNLTTAPPSYQGAGMQKWSSSPVFWAVMLAAGVGGYLYLTSGKKGKQ